MKLIHLTKETYEQYASTHESKPHFSQSTFFYELTETKDSFFYLGLLDQDNKLIAATILIKKLHPLNYSYFFAPNGFILDYSDETLLKKMTKTMVKFVKKRQGTFLLMNPLIKETSVGLIQHFRSASFKQVDMMKNLDRSTKEFVEIDLTGDFSKIKDKFSLDAKEHIKEAKSLNVSVSIGTEEDIDTFYHLMKNNDLNYTKDDYLKFYQSLKKQNMVTLFLANINYSTILDKLNASSKEIRNQLSILPIDNLSKSAKTKYNDLKDQQKNILEKIKKYKQYKDEYGEVVTLSAHIVIHYNDQSWLLYKAHHETLTEPFLKDFLYEEQLKYLNKFKINKYDEEYEDKYLIDNFNAQHIKYTEDFIYITNHLNYFTKNKLIPFYRKKMTKKKNDRGES